MEKPQRHFGRAVARLLAMVAAMGMIGCASNRPLPPERPASLVYRDLERLVTIQSTAGWQIDRIEVEDLLPNALMSTCQIEPAQRVDLMAWIDQRIEVLGGPVEVAYQARGKNLGEVSDLLMLTRVRMLLERAIANAEQDCPFWIEPDPGFKGRQISTNRWQLSLGGGGRGNLFFEGDTMDLEFGGASRALFGRVIGDHVGLYTGLEFGRGARAPLAEDGTRGNLQVAVEGVAPVVMRYYMVNTFVEGEIGYLARSTEADWFDIEHGIHVGVFIGARAMRVRWFFPGAGFGLAYERTFPTASQGEPLNSIKIGFRGSFDIDL